MAPATPTINLSLSETYLKNEAYSFIVSKGLFPEFHDFSMKRMT